MIDQLLVPALVVIAVVVGYAIVRWRLIVATQEFRIKTACQADDLLDEPQLSPLAKGSLIYCIQNAFDGWLPWRLVAGLVVALILPDRFFEDLPGSSISEDEKVAKRWRRTIGNFIVCSLATSPMAGLLSVVILFVALLVNASTRGVGRLTRLVVERLAGRPLRHQN